MTRIIVQHQHRVTDTTPTYHCLAPPPIPTLSHRHDSDISVSDIATDTDVLVSYHCLTPTLSHQHDSDVSLSDITTDTAIYHVQCLH
jgi:hypothetical protein